MTEDDRYIRCKMQNFPQQLQTPISQKQKIFLDFLLHIWNVHQIYNILKKKDEHPSLVIAEIIDSERVGYLNV